MSLQPHQQRVVQEKLQRKDELLKLAKFLDQQRELQDRVKDGSAEQLAEGWLKVSLPEERSKLMEGDKVKDPELFHRGLVALNAMRSSSFAKQVPEAELMRLHRQARIMQELVDILDERIQAFPEFKAAVDDIACDLYELYCREVGGFAFNGDSLPPWNEFSTDPNKTKQANSWRAVGESAFWKSQPA